MVQLSVKKCESESVIIIDTSNIACGSHMAMNNVLNLMAG